MKRYALALLVGGLGLVFASSAWAYLPLRNGYPVGEGINNTVHDLGHAHNNMSYLPSPADPLTRICIFCHAPHNAYRLHGKDGAGPEAPVGFDYLPLWNHSLEGFDPNFTPYENGTGGPGVGPKASQAILNGMTIGSSSLLCLSCHDGSIAVNKYGNGDQISESNGATTIDLMYQIGKSKYLGNHHPIGFDYIQAWNEDRSDMGGGLRQADITLITHTTTIQDHLSGADNTRMECPTCHSVHNKGNTGETLLWRSDQNSELCLTCHDKGLYTTP